MIKEYLIYHNHKKLNIVSFKDILYNIYEQNMCTAYISVYP